MLDFSLDRFPLRTTLRDGTACSFRPMEAGDEGQFRDFHQVIPEREQLFIRNRIRDGSLFREWIRDPSFNETFPLVAFVDGKLVAMGLLRQRLGGWKRHIGRVNFLTHPDFHGLGLIDQLLGEIVDVSRDFGLVRLETEINGERKNAIDSMAAVGFEEIVRIPDYVQDMKGDYHDYVLMTLELIPAFENLGAGD